jgi:hypothetical protein
MGIVSYLSVGLLFFCAIGTRFYLIGRVGFNILPITTRDKVITGLDEYDYDYVYHQDRPIEFGFQFGIGW